MNQLVAGIRPEPLVDDGIETRRRVLGFGLLTMVLVGIAASARVLTVSRYYFFDDTQNGAYGQWYELGGRLLEGRWDVLAPSAWQAGNYTAEGQWGLFSPLSWVIGIAVHLSPNAVVVVTAVKVALLVAMGLGVFLLARSYGATAPWAMLAGTAAPLAGFTTYMDGPSWATGLVNSALLPFAWWGLRRLLGGRNPLAYLVPAYLLVSAGYVFGVIMLAIVLVATVVERLIARDRGGALRALLAGVFAALVTVTVYLPGLLTAPVTTRSGTGIASDRFLNADLADLLASSISTGLTSVKGYWGEFEPAPLQYAAWFLPLFVALPLGSWIRRRHLPLLALGAVTLLLVIGPSVIGPLRYPVRFMPFLVIVVVVLFAIAAGDRLRERLSPARVGAAAALWIAGAWVAWSDVPGNGVGLTIVVVMNILAAVAMAVIADPRWLAWTRPRREAGMALVASIAVLAVLLPQSHVSPTSPLGQFKVPSSVAELKQPLAGAPDDAIVVGDVYTLQQDPAAYRESLIANLWYVNGHRVANVYTVLPYTGFSKDLCMDLRGATCRQLFSRLFSTDPTTGRPVADLLSLNTVLVLRSAFDGRRMPAAPDGWHVAERGDFTVTYVRDEPVPSAGGVVWQSSGVQTTVLAQSDREVRLRVDRTTADGRVVFSRLDWPGYRVDGAAIADRTRDYLLTIDVARVRPGDTVTVRFDPPGWTAELGALALALLIGASWVAVAAIARLRRRGLSRSATDSRSRPE